MSICLLIGGSLCLASAVLPIQPNSQLFLPPVALSLISADYSEKSSDRPTLPDRLMLQTQPDPSRAKPNIPMNRTLTIDLRNYSPDPYDYFPKIHQAVSDNLAEAGIATIPLAGFKLTLVPDDEQYVKGTIFYRAVVSVNYKGRQYQQASFYAAIKIEDELQFLGRIDPDEFINLFNKILRDQGSSHRLYTSEVFSDTSSVEDVKDYSQFQIIALTPEEAFQAGNRYFDFSAKARDELITSERIEQILALIQDIGLLNHLTVEQVAKGKQKIAQSYITAPYEILGAFDDLLITFDWETGNLENPYQDLTYRYAAASQGNFKPTQVSNEFDFDKEMAGLSFTVEGIRYSRKLKFNDDWLDPEFLNLIKEAMQQTVSNGRLYGVLDGESWIGEIFLTNQQKEALESAKIFSLSSN